MRHFVLAATSVLSLVACGHPTKDQPDSGDSGPTGDDVPIASDRSILLYTDTTPVDMNAAQLPADWTGPQETQCATDPTRQYLGEVFTSGLNDIEVNWHWAPIIGGPDPTRPTVDQPEWWYAGTFDGGNDSSDDVLADHPFGLDYSWDAAADPDFAFMPFAGDEGGTDLHLEIEQGTFPRHELGYEPAVGGRVLDRGVWVLDCGHPPYGAEMHPPTFLSFADPGDGTTTSAMAIVEPYRSSLLFNADSSLADQFTDVVRYTDAATLSFPHEFIASVLDAVAGNVDHISTPALMVANQFPAVDFLVCAPLPRPAGATLDAHWRVVARTGITATATEEPDGGCVRVQASQATNYEPLALPYAQAPWSWADLSASASGQLGSTIDVRQAIIDALAGLGIDASQVTALQEDHPPMVDSYAALAPSADAGDLSGQNVETDDTQAFPLTARVSAGWK